MEKTYRLYFIDRGSSTNPKKEHLYLGSQFFEMEFNSIYEADAFIINNVDTFRDEWISLEQQDKDIDINDIKYNYDKNISLFYKEVVE